MKHLLYNNLLRVFSVMTAVAILAGCDSAIYDEEGDCDPVHVIRFCYDMNLKFADAFPAEVPSVDLYVYNSEGRLVTTVSRDVTREEAADFSIELRGLAPDHYDLLAWCGVKGSNYFQVNPAGVADPAMDQLICRIDREVGTDGGDIRNDIGRLYHGRLDDVDMTADEGHYEHIVQLTKDTNIVRVVLQHLSGAPMSKDDYIFTITDANGLYDHNNLLLDDMPLTYHPWNIEEGEASFFPEDEPSRETADAPAGQRKISAVICEFTVGRLMADRNKQVALTVHDNKGRLIFSIPMIDYMLMVQGYHKDPDGRKIGSQEYLDRQDEYPMTFFLDEQHEWIKTLIYINSWRIVRNDSSVH